MHDAREMAEYNRSAPLLYHVANLLTNEKNRVEYRQCHPYFDRLPEPAPRKPTPDAPEGIMLLKSVFIDRRPTDS